MELKISLAGQDGRLFDLFHGHDLRGLHRMQLR
jgi:hypothetical protein